MVVLRIVLTHLEPTPAPVILASSYQLIIMDATVFNTYVFSFKLSIRHPNSPTFTVDIDECRENTDGCSQICTNTIGSYRCSCNSGYRLGTDGHTCNGIQHYFMIVLSQASPSSSVLHTEKQVCTTESWEEPGDEATTMHDVIDTSRSIALPYSMSH